MANALAVMAMAEPGTMLNAPDTYMDKIAIGPGYPDGLIDLDAEPGDNINAMAGAKGCRPGDITALVMDRPRHEQLIAKIRKAGRQGEADHRRRCGRRDRNHRSGTGVDIYIGMGGAPEGVLAAEALRCVGGQMQGRLVFRNEDERKARRQMGHQGPRAQIRPARPDLGRCWCSPPPASPTAPCCAGAPCRWPNASPRFVVMKLPSRCTPRSMEPSVDAGGGEHHIARDQVAQAVFAREVLDAPFGGALALVLVAEHQPALHLAADAAKRRRASTPSGAPPMPI